MTIWVPEIGDIIAAVIGLACRGGEQLRVPKVYSVLRELKERDALLSGLYFSITGAVCYSRQVDEALRSLVAKGMLILKERDTLVVRDDAAEAIRARLRDRLPSPAYRSLWTASKRFYGKMFRTRESRPPSL
ncbi:MAG TPA: hypothetical protein VF847_07655 [Candidatus Deferrimicrobiaceae bacterium]